MKKAKQYFNMRVINQKMKFWNSISNNIKEINIGITFKKELFNLYYGKYKTLLKDIKNPIKLKALVATLGKI